MFLVLNKMDDANDEEVYKIFLELSGTLLPVMGISLKTGIQLNSLPERIYKLTDLIRAYTKAPGKDADKESPFVLPKGSTLEHLALKIHKDFGEKLRFAKVWGRKVFEGQMVHRDYELEDGDIVEIHT